jgi:hypothetical protein
MLQLIKEWQNMSEEEAWEQNGMIPLHHGENKTLREEEQIV